MISLTNPRRTITLPYTGTKQRQFAYWDRPAMYWVLWDGKPYGRNSDVLGIYTVDMLQDWENFREKQSL